MPNSVSYTLFKGVDFEQIWNWEKSPNVPQDLTDWTIIVQVRDSAGNTLLACSSDSPIDGPHVQILDQTLNEGFYKFIIPGEASLGYTWRVGEFDVYFEDPNGGSYLDKAEALIVTRETSSNKACFVDARRTFTVRRHVSFEQVLTYRPGGQDLDLTGFTIYMQVRERDDSDAPVLLQISSAAPNANGSVIEFNADQVANPGQFTIIISPQDAADYPAERGVFDLVIEDAAGKRGLIGKDGWRIVIDDVVTVLEDYTP